MEDFFSTLFLNLKISDELFEDALQKTIHNLSSSEKPLVKSCQWKKTTGHAIGTFCGKKATQQLDGIYYCKIHADALKRKKTGLDKNVIKPLEDHNILQQVQLPELYKVEKRGDHYYIENTLYIIDPERNHCCLGKMINNELTEIITLQNSQTLEGYHVPYYLCKVKTDDIELDDKLKNATVVEI